MTLFAISTTRRLFWSFLACAALLPCRHALATDTYDGTIVNIPTMLVGSVTYSNVVLSVGHIVSGPNPGPASGTVDSYDPKTGYLTVPSVVFGQRTFYNVVTTVAGLRSIGSVSGADSYANSLLTISAVQVGGTVYKDVVLSVTPANIDSIGNGMPLAALDEFTGSTGLLTIPAVQVGSRVYTNVTLTVSLKDVVSVGGGSSGGGGYWVPIGEVGATNGFGVVPSDLSSGTLTQVNTTGVKVALNPVYRFLFSATTFTGDSPFAQLFGATGSDGNIHFYSSQLSNAAAPATPVQVGTFSVPSAEFFCTNRNYGYADIRDPTTAFFALEVFTAAQAGNDGTICSDNTVKGTEYLIHVSDSATTAPVGVNNVAILDGFTELYDPSGKIAGLVAFDLAGNMNYYPAANGQPSYASPSLLAANVTPAIGQSTPLVYNRDGSLLPGGSQAFIIVTANASGDQQLWRIQANGTATMVFDTSGQLSGFVYDDNNYYFGVATSPVGSTVVNTAFYAVSLVSGAPILLATTTDGLSVFDSDGSRLILGDSTGSRLLSLSVSAPGAFQQFFSTPSGFITGASLDYPTDQLFVNVSTGGIQSAAVVTPAGQINQALTAGMKFISGVRTSAGESVSQILAARGITATDGTMGGGALLGIDLSTLASTPIELAGSPYVVPAATTLQANILPNSLVEGVGLSSGGSTNYGFLIDLNSDRMITTTASSTTHLIPGY